MTEPVFGIGKPTPVVLVGTDGNTYNASGGSAGGASAANQETQITEAQATNTKIGEVQPSPTDNTVLGRLKDIDTAILSLSRKHKTDILGTLLTTSKQVITSHTQAMFADNDLWDTKVNAGGTATWTQTHGGFELTVTNTGDYAIRQSKLPSRYLASAPMLWELSTIDMRPVAGVIKRWGKGHYHANFTLPDGFFFITDDTHLWIKIFKAGTAVFEARQDTWDDPLDGTGASGITLDLEKFQVIGGAYLYYGGTDCDFTIVINREQHVIHTFHNSNTGLSTFIESPYQPTHVSIQRVSGTGVAKTYEICSAEALGAINAVKTRYRDYLYNVGGTRTVTTNTVGTIYALMSVRKTIEFATASLAAVKVTPTTAETIEVTVRRNPTIAGAALTYTSTAFGYEIGMAAVNGSNTVTGGEVIHRDAVILAANTSVQFSFDNLLMYLGTKIDLTSDEFVLCVEPETANMACRAQLSVQSLG